MHLQLFFVSLLLAFRLEVVGGGGMPTLRVPFVAAADFLQQLVCSNRRGGIEAEK